MAEADQRPGQVGDVRLHPAGDVEGVRADQADPHAVRPWPDRFRLAGARLPVLRSARSARHSGCSMCQSAGCSPMPRSKMSAISWVPPRTCADSRVPGSVIGGWMWIAQPPIGEAQVRRAQVGCRSTRPASPGRAASVAVSPKNVTGTPLADRSRSPTSGTMRAGLQPFPQHRGRVLAHR